MKRIAFLGLILATAVITYTAYSQCQKTHYLCMDSFSKEEAAEYWNLNNQSKSAVFAKGEDYEMSFIAYKGYQYRVSACTDIVEGAGERVTFELFQEVLKKEDGLTHKVKESFYKNTDDGNAPYVKYTSQKTTKIFIKLSVPATGESKNRKLNNTDNVCVGVLIEHKKAPKLGF